jgi:DNA primase
VAGRIRDGDVELVKERADLAEVIGDVVTLRHVGGGRFIGLCPFHDEKSPSFSVRPSVGLYNCFGCGEGGDVISFVMKVDQLTFSEAVERLAARTGVQLRYEDGGATPNRQAGQRTRLVEAHRAAAQFYAGQLGTPEAVAGRDFLAERGFDQAAAEHFGVGFAPRGWDALVVHLRGLGFSPEELVTAGLASLGRRGPIDRFKGRLLWPIRDISGNTIGFGARRLFDDDLIFSY